MRQYLLVGLVGLAGCATATPSNEAVDAPPGGTDAPRLIDARLVDAPPACTVTTTNLLTNGAFESVTTGWMETRIDGEAIVRNDGPVTAHTPAFKAWMGGVLSDLGGPKVTDVLWQDVAIPASTTMLVVTGMYDVRTSETSGTAFDTGSLALVTTANAPIESVLALSNLTPKTAWTAINHTVVASVAGMTVRLRLTSSNDFLAASGFYFDSLALNATHCGP